MANYLSSDKNLLSAAFSRLLQMAGIRENSYLTLFSDLLATQDEPLNLYVSTSGNDANRGTASDPFRTIQAAVNYIPKFVRGQVVINVGAGNFAGAIFSSFHVTPSLNPATETAGIEIRGTLADFVPATGTTSGTVTNYVAQSTNVMAVVTDTGQSWTIGDLKDKFLVITAGTGSAATAFQPAVYPIIDNTATTVTILGVITAIGAGATYRIQDQGTIIDTPWSSPVVSNTSSANFSPLVLSAFSFSGGAGIQFAFNRLGIALHSVNMNSGFPSIPQSGIRLYAVKMTVTSGNALRGIGGQTNEISGRVDAANCIFKLGDGVSTLSLVTSSVQHSVSSCFFNSTAATSSTGIALQNCGSVAVISSVFRGYTNAISLARSSNNTALVASCRFENNTSAISTPVSASLPLAGGTVGIVTTDFTNNTTAFSISAPLISVQLTTCTGTGNTTAIALSQGAKMKVAPAVTLTGTTEVTLDGAAGTTLAAMRAASPKLLTNTYGTLIFE